MRRIVWSVYISLDGVVEEPSTTLPKADRHNSTSIRGKVAEEVAKLKQQPGKNILIGGIALAYQGGA